MKRKDVMGDVWSDAMTQTLAPNPTITAPLAAAVVALVDPTASGVIPVATAPVIAPVAPVIAPMSNTKKYAMYGGAAIGAIVLFNMFSGKK
jgi:hypothetical protein